MEIHDLIQRFSNNRENQAKAIFSTLFIAGNRLQTLFDQHIPEITLKQFMLLTMVRQSGEPLSFTQAGKLLGCSRQNIKKLAYVLEKKGYLIISRNEKDVRASYLALTKKCKTYFETIFISYQKELNVLFEAYSTAEIEQLFHLMMKLYAGIDNMGKQAQEQNENDSI